jgi:phosphatidylserine decarboxylase
LEKKANIQKQNYRNGASRIAGFLANIKKPKCFVNLYIYLFSKYYKIKLEKFIIPEKKFKSFNDFFTRKYKPEYIEISEENLISPVDGFLLENGEVSQEKILRVKDKDYYLKDLTGEANLEPFNSYAVLYLAPGNYHRVHASFNMIIHKIKYIPGTLRSVKTKVINKRERVYCRNERIILSGESVFGKFCFILIGALFVGKIRLCFESGLSSNIRKGLASIKEYQDPITINKGEELGYFEMGSSVVIVLEDEILKQITLKENHIINFGKSF